MVASLPPKPFHWVMARIKCKLCGEEADSCRAHIYPEWFFVHNIGKNVRPFLITTDIDDPQKRKGQVDGVYDVGILCRSCDNGVLGALDGVGFRLYKGSERHTSADYWSAMFGYYTIRPEDCRDFRRFVFSLYLRAFLTGQKPFDSSASGIPPHQIDEILTRIRGEVVDGPCQGNYLTVLLREDAYKYRGVVQAPITTKLTDGTLVSGMQFGLWQFYINIGIIERPTEIFNYHFSALNAEGRVCRVDMSYEYDSLREVVGKIESRGNLKRSGVI